MGAGRGQGWRWGCGQRDPARLPHARPRARPAELITSGIHCCSRRPERRRRQGGASGGQGGSSLRAPESPVPSPGTQRSPAGRPSPCRGRPGGRRRQSPSGPGKEPGRPSQVSVRGEGEAERAGPRPRRSRIELGKPARGRGLPGRARTAGPPAAPREWSSCALSTTLGGPIALAANPQTEFPAFSSGRKLADRKSVV